MPIRVRCPGCNNSLKAREELAGKRLKCPSCGAAVVVPELRSEQLLEFDEGAHGAARERDARPTFNLHLGLEGLSADYRVHLGRWFEISRLHFSAIVGPCVGYLFLFMLIYTIVVLLHFIIIGFLLDPFVIPALAIGMHIVCQKQLKGEPWTFATFFSGFQFVWPLAARAILMLLVPVVFLVPAFILLAILNAIVDDPKSPVVAGLGVMIMMTAGCAITYVTIRLVFFSHFLIIDRRCGPIQALKGSWILSRGHFWGLFGSMMLLLFGVYLVGFLTFGIGMLFALPRVVLLLNAGYLDIAGSAPLPGVTKAEPVRPEKSKLAWIPVACCAAVIFLFGVLVTFASYSARSDLEDNLRRRKETNQASSERAKQEQAMNDVRAREDVARRQEQAREITAFFRSGGYYAITVSEAQFNAAARPDPGPAAGPPGGGIGGVGPSPDKVMILGPKDLVKNRAEVKLGEPVEPGPGDARIANALKQIHTEWTGGWEAFRQEFAEALSLGDVEAVIVEVIPDKAVGGGASAPGMPPGPADAVGYGDGPWFGRLRVGTPIALEKAKRVTSGTFLELTAERGWR